MAILKKRSAKYFDIIIGLDSSINGEITSKGSIRIDGKVTGSIKADGDVIIGGEAIVQAGIQAHYCEISGNVVGNVTLDTQLKVFEGGSLTGDIVVSSFTVEGGSFNGNCDINPNRNPKTTSTNEKAKNDKKIS